MVKDGHNPTCRHNVDFSKTQEQVQKKTQSFPLRVCDPALSIVLLSLHSSALEIHIKADFFLKISHLLLILSTSDCIWVGGWLEGSKGEVVHEFWTLDCILWLGELYKDAFQMAKILNSVVVSSATRGQSHILT